MATLAHSLDIHWKCRHTWRQASYNTSWCLLGCSIGDFGTIAFFQFAQIPFPVFLRLSMGVYGARYVAILRGLVGVFMFGVANFHHTCRREKIPVTTVTGRSAVGSRRL